MPRALDLPGKLSLVFGAQSGLAPRPDLAATKDVSAQTLGLLVVNHGLSVHTKSAETGS